MFMNIFHHFSSTKIAMWEGCPILPKESRPRVLQSSRLWWLTCWRQGGEQRRSLTPWGNKKMWKIHGFIWCPRKLTYRYGQRRTFWERFCTFWGGTWLSNSTRIQKTISFVNNQRETPVENSCSPSFLWVFFHISYKCWCFSHIYIYIYPSMYPTRITIYRWLADMKEQYYSYIISPWWTHCITKVANYMLH